MSDKFDTSWFNPLNYNTYSTFSIEEWQWQLSIRTTLHEYYENHYTSIDEIDQRIIEAIKTGIIKKAEYPFLERVIFFKPIIPYPIKPTVDSLRSIDIWHLIKDFKLTNIGDACKHYAKFFFRNELDTELAEIATRPHGLNIEKYFNYDKFNTYYVSVDLVASDEQLKEDFSSWLEKTRKQIKKKKKRRFVKQADFDQWVKHGVIPYLDLTFMAKLEGKKITQDQIGDLIFPNQLNVTVSERIRKVTKPLAEWLINDDIGDLLNYQIIYEQNRNKKQRKTVPE